jgi:MFS transporter, MHS family, proline/betaine transporter
MDVNNRLDEVTRADSASSARRTALVVRGGTIGTAVEYYDFGIYGYTATTLALVFFSGGSEASALLATLALFAVAFFVRPIGGVIFGHIGDRMGRRLALTLTVMGMCGATAAIGLIPSYAAIGLGAPVLLLLARLLQGICAGGEIGGAATYIAESCDEKRRGFLTSMTEFGSMIGLILASAVVAAVAWLTTPDQLHDWAWRIPFLISLPLGIVGLLIRLRLEDSPAFKAVEDKGEVVSTPIVQVIKSHRAALLRVIGINALASPGYYVAFVYSNIFLQQVAGMTATAAAWITTLTLVLATITIPFAALASDRYGRRPVLAVGSIGLMVLAYPAFMLMDSHVILLAMLGQASLGICEGIIMGALMAAMAEQFPTTVRYTGLALGFNLGASIFGGASPYVATWLIAATGVALAPSFILVVLAFAAIAAIVSMTETARKPLPLV